MGVRPAAVPVKRDEMLIDAVLPQFDLSGADTVVATTLQRTCTGRSTTTWLTSPETSCSWGHSAAAPGIADRVMRVLDKGPEPTP